MIMYVIKYFFFFFPPVPASMCILSPDSSVFRHHEERSGSQDLAWWGYPGPDTALGWPDEALGKGLGWVEVEARPGHQPAGWRSGLTACECRHGCG